MWTLWMKDAEDGDNWIGQFQSFGAAQGVMKNLNRITGLHVWVEED